MNKVITHFDTVLYCEKRDIILGMGQIITTKKFVRKVKSSLKYFRVDIPVTIVEDYTKATDFQVLECYREFSKGAKSLSKSLDCVYMLSSIVVLLEPIKSPMDFKVPQDKKEWYQTVNGSKIKLRVEDISEIDIIGEYFPVFGDLSLILSTIISQFKGGINTEVKVLEQNMFRSAKTLILDKKIKDYMEKEGMVYKEARRKALDIVEDRDYAGVYKLKDAMFKTLVN